MSQFIEEQAILAAQDNDVDELRWIIEKLHKGEVLLLARGAELLAKECRDAIADKRYLRNPLRGDNS